MATATIQDEEVRAIYGRNEQKKISEMEALVRNVEALELERLAKAADKNQLHISYFKQGAPIRIVGVPINRIKKHKRKRNVNFLNFGITEQRRDRQDEIFSYVAYNLGATVEQVAQEFDFGIRQAGIILGKMAIDDINHKPRIYSESFLENGVVRKRFYPLKF